MAESVVETEEFLRQVAALISEQERMALVDFVSRNPEVGVSLGAGLRKVRYARAGAGKSGGYRVIHFYKPDRRAPVFLRQIYAKNVQESLTPHQLDRMKALGDAILANYGRKN